MSIKKRIWNAIFLVIESTNMKNAPKYIWTPILSRTQTISYKAKNKLKGEPSCIFESEAYNHHLLIVTYDFVTINQRVKCIFWFKGVFLSKKKEGILTEVIFFYQILNNQTIFETIQKKMLSQTKPYNIFSSTKWKISVMKSTPSHVSFKRIMNNQPL